MSLIRNSKKDKYLKPNELEVLYLILSGEHPTLQHLKKQINPEYIIGVERTYSTMQTICGFNVQNKLSTFQLQFILPYDNSSLSVGKNVSFRLSDLVIVDNTKGMHLCFDLIIIEGDLSYLLGVVNDGKFPFDFKVDEWFYKNSNINGGTVLSSERDLSIIPVKTNSSYAGCELTDFQNWLIKPTKNKCIKILDNNKHCLNNPTTYKEINSFMTKHCISLPKDFIEFLLITNGCNFFGVPILGTEELFIIEFPKGYKFLPFHSWSDGNYTAFNINKDYTVCFLCHDPFGYSEISLTFKDWLQRVEEEVQKTGELVHPFARDVEGIYRKAVRELIRFNE